MELHEDDGKATPRTLLGRRLRRLREAAELSQRALAERVGYPHTYLSRVERGEQLPSEALAQALDDYFSADGLFMELLDMAQDSLIANYSREFVAKERDAIRIQVFTSSTMPGLLQTEDYTRECYRKDPTAETLNELDARVAARMKRQRIFNAAPPPRYWAIMDEAVLKRPTADRRIMREQLQHILKMAENPHITIQVLTFDRALHTMMGGSLTLLTLKDGAMVALVESFASGEAVDSPNGVVELVERFDIARSMALMESESLDLIRRYLEEYADES
ncbi:helix-turn-helix domain-containing protein [Streptomyces noursei]|uniref:helix-turn-helix domain-containing protein n=1 Tax=Streptomyces noursei TaxID=1971 RepID=UPI00167B4780|nr:helix-turn-helix transcriptional regulator [Streptomyces noursei]MCZ1016049.1 helix-turn-helix transcriptional regulator [Streptomyces noursei]GGW92630.1 transcriptional regulator [Streptomyces noursei]